MVVDLSFFAFDTSDCGFYGHIVFVTDRKTFKVNAAIVKPSGGF
jgi:hypothetical protein